MNCTCAPESNNAGSIIATCALVICPAVKSPAITPAAPPIDTKIAIHAVAATPGSPKIPMIGVNTFPIISINPVRFKIEITANPNIIFGTIEFVPILNPFLAPPTNASIIFPFFSVFASICLCLLFLIHFVYPETHCICTHKFQHNNQYQRFPDCQVTNKWE